MINFSCSYTIKLQLTQFIYDTVFIHSTCDKTRNSYSTNMRNYELNVLLGQYWNTWETFEMMKNDGDNKILPLVL